MTTDANEPDTQELFRRFLDGRQPRRLEDVQQRLATELRAAPTKRRLPRRAGLVAMAAAVLVVAAIAVVAVRGNNGPESLRTATDPDSTITSPTSGPLPADAPVCGPEELPPNRPGQPSASISNSYPPTNVTDHFGDRFNSIWTGAYVPALGNNQRVMIAATNITDADRTWAATVPVTGGHIQLVEAKYSLTQLKEFATRLRTKIPNWSLPKEYAHVNEHQSVQDLLSSTTRPNISIPRSVYPPGLYNVSTDSGRLDGTDNFGEKVVTVSVTECSTDLRAQLVSVANSVSVPADALRIQGYGYP
jgi:hypothetical protein